MRRTAGLVALVALSTIVATPAQAADAIPEIAAAVETPDSECAVQFRQILVHAVRKMRPLRLIVDLAGVTAIDPINLGTLAALCGLADDHQVVVFLHNSPANLAADLRAAGVPPQRFAPGQPEVGRGDLLANAH